MFQFALVNATVSTALLLASVGELTNRLLARREAQARPALVSGVSVMVPLLPSVTPLIDVVFDTVMVTGARLTVAGVVVVAQ